MGRRSNGRAVSRRSFLASLALHSLLVVGLFVVPVSLMRGETQADMIVVAVASPERPKVFPDPPEEPVEIEEIEIQPEPPEAFEAEIEPEPLPPDEFEVAELAPEPRLPLELNRTPKVEPEPDPPAPEPPVDDSVAQQEELELEPQGADVENAPELIAERSPKPRYPRRGQRMGWEGEVVCRITVGTDGRVVRAVVEESSGHELLDRVAREAVLAWHFVPGTRGGVPAEMDVLKRLLFRLDGT